MECLVTIATIVIAIFTCCLWWSTDKMWKATNKTADAAKESASAAQKSADALPATERAYVFVEIEAVDIEFLHGFNEIDKGDVWYFRFDANIMMRNYGKTPAIINKIRSAICLERPFISQIQELENPQSFILGSDGEDKWKRTPSVSKRIDKKELFLINNENIRAYCCGQIEYKDVFGKEHITGFCWEYRTNYPDPGGIWFSSDEYKDMNYYI